MSNTKQIGKLYDYEERNTLAKDQCHYCKTAKNNNKLLGCANLNCSM